MKNKSNKKFQKTLDEFKSSNNVVEESYQPYKKAFMRISSGIDSAWQGIEDLESSFVHDPLSDRSDARKASQAISAAYTQLDKLTRIHRALSELSTRRY